MTSTLQQGEELAAEGATAPRVTLESMEARIEEEEYLQPTGRLRGLTICVLTLDNGWILVGKSAPADVRNFDAEKGKTFARDDALRQLWPLEGYLLREKLHVRSQQITDGE